MAADAYFIGTPNHPICQDYALAKEGMAVVCDGCSGEKHTDWGARLLAWAAISNNPNSGPKLSAYRFVRSSADGASWDRANIGGFQPSMLAATLLFVEETKDGADVIIAGDGYVLARLRDGRIEIHRYASFGEAPFYPLYTLSNDSIHDYYERGYGGWTHTEVCGDDTKHEFGHHRETGYPHTLSFSRDKYDIVLIASDGLDRFTQLGVQEPVSRIHVYDIEVCQRIMQFKSLAGEFVQRRMRAEMKAMHEEGWLFTDDVSVAGITLELSK
jgi:hypothetical protein